MIKPHIKSFVKRDGRFTRAQKEAFNISWPVYGLEKVDKPLNFNSIFKNTHPVSLEIGFGMGDTLVELAKASPFKNFIGIDIYKPGIGNLLAHLKAQNIENVRIFREDAVEILNTCIPDETLEAVYLLFPDPWPKRKHHKRRIIQPEFLQLLSKKLILNGSFHLATDWEDYAKHMMETLTASPDFKNAYGSGRFAPKTYDRQPTKFEKRGERLGHPIWELLFKKI